MKQSCVKSRKGQIRKVKKEKQNLLKKQKKKPCVRQKKTQKREKENSASGVDQDLRHA